MNSPCLVRWPVRLVAAGAIALGVWALRVSVVVDLGTGIPFWDQWDREGLIIYEPWIQGHLSWRAVFEPHLEHRIVWTHLWNLGLLKLCGQWDPMVQMVAQAAIPAATAGFSVWSLMPVCTSWLWRVAILCGTLIAFGAPFAHGNILWGFQSSFALFVALSLGVCAATALTWRNCRYLWLAMLAGMAAPLAMGAGALTGPIIIALTILVTLIEKKFSRLSSRLLGIGLICSLWGYFLRSDSTTMMFARAESISSFLKIWLTAVAWPNCQLPLLAGLACLPVILLAVCLVRRHAKPQPNELFIVGVSVWAIGCAAGGAWTRGAVDPVPPSRYGDFLALLCWANLLAMVVVLRTWWLRSNSRPRAVVIGFAVTWISGTVYGGVRMLGDFYQNQRSSIQVAAGRHFEAVNQVLGGAPVDVMIGAGLQNVPSVLRGVMNSQVLAPYLPPELQMPPRNIAPEGVIAIGLARDGDRKWQSGIFETKMPSLIMFVHGEQKELNATVVDLSRRTKSRFRPSGRHLGNWSEWLVRTPPGSHQIIVDAGLADGGLAFTLPRPVNAMGYWIRSGIPNSEVLCGTAGFCLVAALLASRTKPKIPGADCFSPIKPDAK